MHFWGDGATMAQTNESEGFAMETKITREQAYGLLTRYNQEPFHIQHALTVEGVMRWFARQLGAGGPPARRGL